MVKFFSFIMSKWFYITMTGLLFLNILIRLLIYFNSSLFYFADYQAYLEGIETIAKEGKVTLLKGNFLMTISYMGYYAKYVLGSIDYFYVFNAILATIASLLVSLLVYRVSHSPVSAIIAMGILTIYTEFMVFSSVFYTPVIMIFLLSLFMWGVYCYFWGNTFPAYLSMTALAMIFLISFLFKPELIFLPFFLLIFSFIHRKKVEFAKKIFLLSLVLGLASLLFISNKLFSKEYDRSISNSFIFFGHTDYGGDGGEGSFVYPENKARYDSALYVYMHDNNIANPDVREINEFQIREIQRFITKHPLRWLKLQLTKFFRTFGIVPEGTSFKVLYSGLLKERIGLTSVIVVAPVALILLLFIQVFNIKQLKYINLNGKSLNTKSKLSAINSQSLITTRQLKNFGYFCLVFFIYYIFAICFFGHYQERYRLPVMVIFIIPTISILITKFNYLL